MLSAPVQRWSTVLAILLVALAATGWRVRDLDARPMHHDEANQAVRAGLLLDQGLYEYDPHEHHGPTLYYFTLPIARLSGQSRFADTTETTYRLLPVVFGLLTLLLTLGLRRELGNFATVWAVAFAAVSSGLTFYSRFYIQETLLVCFTFGLLVAGRRYWRSRRLRWAILAGVAAGLMHTTKETCVLAWGAMGLAVLIQIRTPERLRRVCRRLSWRHALAFAATATAVSVVLFSSFFQHGRGPLDSILTYGVYLGRAGTEGRHLHPSPWHYLRLMAWQREGGILFRPELVILILAGAGAVSAFRRRDRNAGFARFLALYVAILTAGYSLISYKTPWCILSSLHGMTLLAGLGIEGIRRLGRPRWGTVSALLLGAGALWFTWGQCRLVNGRFRADERNPYVYVHTVPDFLKLVQRIEDIAAVAEQGRGVFLPVVTPVEDAWPLPWYLRRYPQVGYWLHPSELPEFPAPPPLLVATPEFEDAIRNILGDSYLSEYYGLRPEQGVLLALYIRPDLWERFLETRTTK